MTFALGFVVAFLAGYLCGYFTKEQYIPAKMYKYTLTGKKVLRKIGNRRYVVVNRT